jgi:hypothetical protein
VAENRFNFLLSHVPPSRAFTSRRIEQYLTLENRSRSKNRFHSVSRQVVAFTASLPGSPATGMDF